MKTMICTCVGCQLHIARQNRTFAHLTVSCLHISGWIKKKQICAFEGAVFAQMWLLAHLRVKCLHKCGWLHIWGWNVCTKKKLMWLILDENNDLHICGMFAHFTSKLNLSTFDGVMFAHKWLMYFIYIQICTFEGAVFAQMWLFAHLRAKCSHKCGCLHICGFCTFHGSTRQHVSTFVVDIYRVSQKKVYTFE